MTHNPQPATATPAPPAPRFGPAAYFVGVALALAALWALDLAALNVKALTTFKDLEPLSPLYAFWQPQVRPHALAFAALAAAAVLAAPRLADPARTSRGLFCACLAAAALLLPLALFASREPLPRLGRQFIIYQEEEYYLDALAIKNLPGFVRHYVALTPRLSRHGRTHPPGNAVFLYLVAAAIGRSPLAAGVGVLFTFAAAALIAHRGLAAVLPETQARSAALLLLASPSAIDFACTSMDAVFLAAAGLAVWAGLAALSRRRSPILSLATGAALLLAMLFSFSAFYVGFFLLLYGLAQLRTRGRRVLLELAVILAAFVGSAVLFAALSGFEIWQCLRVASAEHHKQMTHFIGRPPAQLYAYITFGNALAFLIGAGLALVPLALFRTVEAVRLRRLDPLLVAAWLTMAVLVAGGVFTLEVERIWLFAMPWLAALAAAAAGLDAPRLRAALAAGWTQALLMEALLFTLW